MPTGASGHSKRWSVKDGENDDKATLLPPISASVPAQDHRRGRRTSLLGHLALTILLRTERHPGKRRVPQAARLVPARRSSSQVCKTRFLSVQAETGGINREVPFILASAFRIACRRVLVAQSRGQSARPAAVSGSWLGCLTTALWHAALSRDGNGSDPSSDATEAAAPCQSCPLSVSALLSTPPGRRALSALPLSPCTAPGGCQDARQTGCALQVWTLGP